MLTIKKFQQFRIGCHFWNCFSFQMAFLQFVVGYSKNFRLRAFPNLCRFQILFKSCDDLCIGRFKTLIFSYREHTERGKTQKSTQSGCVIERNFWKTGGGAATFIHSCQHFFMKLLHFNSRRSKEKKEEKKNVVTPVWTWVYSKLLVLLLVTSEQ